jgi:hypothetical protein
VADNEHNADGKSSGDSDKEDKPRLGLLQIVGSVLAAGLGVQSSRNRERDFQHGKPVIFILAGLVFTALFIAAVFGVVSVVLGGAGR